MEVTKPFFYCILCLLPVRAERLGHDLPRNVTINRGDSTVGFGTTMQRFWGGYNQ